MFLKYIELIKELANAIKTGKGDIAFSDYLAVLGNTFLLVLVICGSVALLFITFYAPKFVYQKTVLSVTSQLNKIFENRESNESCSNEEQTQIDTLEKKVRKRKAFYFAGLLVGYIPFAVPTLLYFLYILFHI